MIKEKKKMSLFELRNKYKNVIRESESDNNVEENEEEIEDLSDVGCYICGKNTEPENLLVCDRCHSNCCHYYCDSLKKYQKENGIVVFVLKK